MTKTDSLRNVFISYSHEDGLIARRVADSVKEAGLRVWIDEGKMGAGDSFIQKMNEGLGDADYVLFLASQSSIQSRWVSREWMSALADQDKVLIPIRLADVEMPPLLRDLIFIDLATDVEGGLRKIIEFFRKEATAPARATRSASLLASATRRELRLVAKHCLTETDFRECLWDLGIAESDVVGNVLQDRLLFLLQRMDSDGVMSDFTGWLEQNRGPCLTTQMKRLREPS